MVLILKYKLFSVLKGHTSGIYISHILFFITRKFSSRNKSEKLLVRLFQAMAAFKKPWMKVWFQETMLMTQFNYFQKAKWDNSRLIVFKFNKRQSQGTDSPSSHKQLPLPRLFLLLVCFILLNGVTFEHPYVIILKLL